VLSEYPSGISLAQLPQQMKTFLDFDFDPRKLGFLKLKDILALMEDKIKVELRH
jgi:hypothetical protein